MIIDYIIIILNNIYNIKIFQNDINVRIDMLKSKFTKVDDQPSRPKCIENIYQTSLHKQKVSYI